MTRNNSEIAIFIVKFEFGGPSRSHIRNLMQTSNLAKRKSIWPFILLFFSIVWRRGEGIQIFSIVFIIYLNGVIFQRCASTRGIMTVLVFKSKLVQRDPGHFPLFQLFIKYAFIFNIFMLIDSCLTPRWGREGFIWFFKKLDRSIKDSKIFLGPMLIRQRGKIRNSYAHEMSW